MLKIFEFEKKLNCFFYDKKKENYKKYTLIFIR